MTTLQLQAQHHPYLASGINAMHLENRLGDVETDCRDRLRYPDDEQRAQKAITAAKKAGASRDEFQRELNLYLDKNVGNQNHRAALAMKQAKKLEKMWQ